MAARTASDGPGSSGRTRRSTSTSAFGSSRRESHDASGFYERFTAPELSSDTTIATPAALDAIYTADARAMTMVHSDSVALVVTSPPYFAGKQYEEILGENGVPGSYLEYLELLRDVFAECKRVLEPGGRIAVNVANLGRRPYRSLASDVIAILQDDLQLLLRGEVIWWKGRAAGGSCAWGTFQRPGNPVLRDVTERVIIASKGRFDRALTAKQRHAADRPSTATISRDEFLEATTDLWEIAPESATRVGHPAPFPVEIPKRLIDLFTYRGDLVLDPFMGSGTTAVAAVQTDRHYLGFDTDADYAALADDRIAQARTDRTLVAADPSDVVLPAVASTESHPGPEIDPVAKAVGAGLLVRDVATTLLDDAGFTKIRTNQKVRKVGVEMSILAEDTNGEEWAFDVSGGFTTTRSGLKRADTLWKSLGTAAVWHEANPGTPLILLTTDLPSKGSAGAAALGSLTGSDKAVLDVIQLLDDDGRKRLRSYAENGRPAE